MPSQYLWLIPILPFTGFLINGTLGRRLPRAAVTGIALFFTAIPAIIVAMSAKVSGYRQVPDGLIRLQGLKIAK